MPNNAAKIITVKSDRQTVIGNLGSGYRIVQIINRIMQQISPFISATLNSFNKPFCPIVKPEIFSS